ncbi:uncharacterized protein LOC121384601 [Gigantopelta aegis]|uniref:uncharacterized protein LOC121384601 n=1 Tax=Gigantopelta aegis TaxID=1735272 RepID=UPI001B88BC0A|nr:uncharacterized protein LOC121384601 [Gigantopelta aegis]
MEKLSSFEVAPFQGLMNMLKANYLDRPEIFKMVLALLCDFDCTDQNSFDMTVRYLRILLTKNSGLAECLITFLQPNPSSKWTSQVTDSVPTADKETKQDPAQPVKKSPVDQFVYNVPQTKLKQSPGSAFFRPTKMSVSSSGPSAVATLYPTLRSSLVRGSATRAAIPAQFSPFLYPAYFPMMGAPITWMRRPHGCVQGSHLAGTEEALDLTQHHSSSGSDQNDSKEKDPSKSKILEEKVSDEKSFEKSSQKAALEDQGSGENFLTGMTNNASSGFHLPSPSVTSHAEYARVFYQNASQTVGSSGIPYKIMDSSTEVFLGTARNLTSFPYLQRMILPDGQMKTIAFDSDPSHQPQQISPSESSLLDQGHHYPLLRERSAPAPVAKIKPKPVCESSTSSSSTATTMQAAVQSGAETKSNKSKKRPLRTVVQIGLKEKVKKLSKTTGQANKE